MIGIIWAQRDFEVFNMLKIFQKMIIKRQGVTSAEFDVQSESFELWGNGSKLFGGSLKEKREDVGSGFDYWLSEIEVSNGKMGFGLLETFRKEDGSWILLERDSVG